MPTGLEADHLRLHRPSCAGLTRELPRARKPV